ncbi:MAG: gamma-glutamyltransferase [Alphaproteobacteria bacterium]
MLVVLPVLGCAAAPSPGGGVNGRFMVSVAHPLAAHAGAEILRAGGTAVDAAIAVQAALTLVEPQSSGIGGGAFLLHYRKADGRIDAYDGRETAPAALDPGHFLKDDGTARAFRDAAAGGQAVGVPGVIRMLEQAHVEHGRLPWRLTFAPAIELASGGFQVTPRLNRMIGHATGLADFPAARAYFLTPDGAPPPIGFVLRNSALAHTLRRIAAGGAAAFYEGEIAADIARAVRAAARNLGAMTRADIAGYRAKKRDVLCRPYRVWRVCGMPPPTSGGIAVHQILGLLERFPSARVAPGTPEAVHLFAEAMRLAYADRARYVGDPDFVDVPVDGLLDSAYLAGRAAQISADRRMERVSPGKPRGVQDAYAPGGEAAYPSTSHFAVVDGDGNAVSMTTTVERAFGSYILVRGFLLNNQLTDFAFRPRRDGRVLANAAAPGKRPRSSMSPTLIFDVDGRLFAAVGSPGGRRIIGYVAKTVVGLLDSGLPMQKAIDLPNIAIGRGVIEIEPKAGEAVVAGLRARGHTVRIRALVSGLHGIRIAKRGFDGGADARREGVVMEGSVAR